MVGKYLKHVLGFCNSQFHTMVCQFEFIEISIFEYVVWLY